MGTLQKPKRSHLTLAEPPETARDVHRFCERTKFLKTDKGFFVKDGVVKKRKRNERLGSFREITIVFILNERIFQTNLITILLNERYF